MDVMKEISQGAKRVDVALLKYLEVGKYEKLSKAIRHYPEAGGKRPYSWR
jgi:geranylgeranyl pyrophosphate synthase